MGDGLTSQRSRTNGTVYACLTELEGQYQIRKAIMIIILTFGTDRTYSNRAEHDCIWIYLKGIECGTTNDGDFEVLIFLEIDYIPRLLSWLDVDGD